MALSDVKSLDLSINASGAKRGAGDFEKSAKQVAAAAAAADRASKQTRDELGRFGGEARKGSDSLMRMGAELQRWAGLLSTGLALREAQKSFGVFVAFESRMASVRAVANATTADFAKLENQAKSLGATTLFSASQVAEGQQLLAQSGFMANEILGAMPGLLDLALSGQLELGAAASITATSLRGFNLEASQAGTIADILAKAASSSNVTVQGLGDALSYVAPVAAVAKLSVSEVAAAVGVLSDRGIDASRAGTGLRRIIGDLVNPTKEAREAMAALGLDMKDLDPTTHSLADVISTLSKAGIDLNTAFAAFGDQGAPVIMALASSQERLRSLTTELEDSAGAAQVMASIMTNTTKGALDELSSAVEAGQIAFGEGLKPAVVEVAGALAKFFSEGQAGAKAFGAEVGTVLVAFGKIALTVAENIDLVVVALKAWMAYKLAGWALGAAVEVGKLATSLWQVKAAQDGVNAASAANPWGAVIAGAVLLHGWLSAVADRWSREAEAGIAAMAAEGRGMASAVSMVKELRGETAALTEARNQQIESVIRVAIAEKNLAKSALEASEKNLKSLEAEAAAWKARGLLLQNTNLPEQIEQERSAMERSGNQVKAYNATIVELWAQQNRLGVAIEKTGDGADKAGPKILKLKKTLDELKGAALSVGQAIKQMRLDDFSGLNAKIGFTVDVDGAMDGVVAKQRLLINIKEASGQLSADEARILRDQLGVQELINQAKANGIPLTEETIQKMLDGVAKVGAQIKESFNWKAWVYEPGRQAWDATRDYALDAIAAVVSGADVDFKAMFKNLLQMWIRTLAEMVARAVQAKLAQTAMGSGGGGGNVTMGSGGMSGNYAGTAASGAQAANMAGMGTAATVLGVIAVFAAIYFGVDSWIKKQKAKKFAYEPQFQIERIGGNFGGTELTDMALKVGRGIRDLVKTLEEQMGGVISDMPQIALNWRADGKKVRAYVAGVLVGEFDDIQEAISTAMALALRDSKVQADAMIQSVLKNTTVRSLEDLQAQIGTVQEVLSLAMSPLEQDIQKTVAGFDRLRAELVKLPLDLDQLTRGLGILGQAEQTYWQGQYDLLTGHKKSRAEQLEDLKKQAMLFDAQKKLRIAELESQKLKLMADREMLLAQIKLSQVGGQIDQEIIDRDRGFLGARVAIFRAETSAQTTYLEAQLAALDAQMAALDELLAFLKAIPDIKLDDIKLPGTGGGGGGGRSTAQGLIDDANRNKMPDWVGQLFDLQKKFDAAAKPLLPNNRADKIKKLMDKETDPKKLEELEKKYLAALRAAGLNAAALDKLNKARQDEINLLKQQVKDQYAPYLKNWGKSDFRAGINDFLKNLSEIPDALLTPWEKALIKARFLKEQNRDVTARLKEFGGDLFPTAAIDDVRDTANGLRDDLAALAAQGIDVAARLRLVGEAEAFRLQQIEFGLVDTLFGYLKGSAEFEAQRVEFEKQKVQLQFAVIEAQLRALGVWAKYEGLFNAAFKAAMDAAGQITAPTGGSSFESTVNTFADVIKEATDRWRNATRQIADFYRNLMFGNQSPLTGMQTVEAALAAYNSTAALARGGNLGAREQFTTVAQTLLDVLDRAYGSTEFSARLRAQIAADSQNLLGQTSFNEGGVTYGVSWTAVDRSVQDGTRRLVEAVQQAQASQANGSTANAAAISTLAQAILARDGSSLDPELAARLDRVIALWEAEQRRNAA